MHERILLLPYDGKPDMSYFYPFRNLPPGSSEMDWRKRQRLKEKGTKIEREKDKEREGKGQRQREKGTKTEINRER